MSTILAHKKNILVLFLISTILQQKWRYSQFENLQWNLSVYKTRIAYFIQCAQVSLIDKFFHEIIQGLSTNNAPKNKLLSCKVTSIFPGSRAGSVYPPRLLKEVSVQN